MGSISTSKEPWFIWLGSDLNWCNQGCSVQITWPRQLVPDVWDPTAECDFGQQHSNYLKRLHAVCIMPSPPTPTPLHTSRHTYKESPTAAKFQRAERMCFYLTTQHRFLHSDTHNSFICKKRGIVVTLTLPKCCIKHLSLHWSEHEARPGGAVPLIQHALTLQDKNEYKHQRTARCSSHATVR